MGEIKRMSGDASEGFSSIRPMRVSLHLAASFDAAWENVTLPWFTAVAAFAVEEPVPVAVITPFRSHAHLLRSRLLAHGISLLGVRFLVPAQLREFLQTAEMPRVLLRENLRLLLSVAADRCASDSERDHEIDNAMVARSVAREADELLRAIDSVAAAGANFADLASPALSEIARRFEKILKGCGYTLVAEADRQLLQAARASAPRFSNLLINGFDAAHWSLWPLLHAAVLLAGNATVTLRQPRDEAAELDRIWISTWEEEFGPVQQLPPLDPEPRFGALLTLPETPAEIEARKNNPLPDIHLVIGHDSSEQAQAIIALAIAFLNEPSCERLAILLPGPGAVARLVASWLEKLGIPHNDAIAHPMRGTFDTEEWRAWLELQERPRLEPLLRFLEHSPAAIALFAPLSLCQIRDALQRACCDILVNAADVLREYCRSKDDKVDYQAVATGLDAIRFLPERATFKKFVQIADEIFRTLKWTERSAELERLARDWSGGFTADLRREYFLRWLREIFSESSLSRDACGDHPYARVQLLRYSEAEAGSWTHAILAGLNEGVWPPRDNESPFLPDDVIAALNRRNTCQSARFGEGQQVACEGGALCLGARERRALSVRQLLNVIESTRHGIGIAAERYTQLPREQAINPSDFFARLYFSARGEPLSQREIMRSYAHTQRWLAQTDLFKPAKRKDVDVRQTGVAYRARRRADVEFGEYEFSFRKDSPPQKITFSATDIGDLLKRPALVWMKKFLGVQASEINGGSWDLATGLWVHRWLSVIGAPGETRFLPRPSAGEIVGRAMAAADAFHAETFSILKTCGRTREPDWWRSGWRNARHLAEQFAKQLTATEDWPRLRTEWELDSPHTIQLKDGEELRVRGRVDLILARDEHPEEIWIIDYKTGEAKPLTGDLLKQLIAGEGVQICIYALALRRDFKHICASLLARDANLRPQLALAEIAAQDAIWKEIARMQRTGIFGMLGEIRSEFTFTGTYPLATLAVAKYLLEEKWERTHPAFAKQRNR